MYNGITTDAELNYDADQDGIFPAVTANLNYNSINGYTITESTIVTPYGFVSIPDDGESCVYSPIGDFTAAYISGYTNQLDSNSNLSDLLKGETALFSKGNYTLKVKNDKLFITFTNDANDVISSRVTNDENVNTILIDLIAEIKSLETKFNNFITTKFNLHLHSGVQAGTDMSGITTIPDTSYTPTANFVRDDTFLGSDGVKNFIDDNGRVIT